MTTASTLGIGDEVFPVAVDLGDVELARDPGRGLAAAVADSDDPDAGDRFEPGKMPRSRDLAGTDDSDPNLTRTDRLPHHARPDDPPRFRVFAHPDSMFSGKPRATCKHRRSACKIRWTEVAAAVDSGSQVPCSTVTAGRSCGPRHRCADRSRRTE